MGEETTDVKNVKFTQEELDSIKAIQTEYQAKTAQFGQLRVQMLLTKQLEETIINEFKALQEQEKSLVAALNEKYGAGTLNPQTGEFVPQPK